MHIILTISLYIYVLMVICFIWIFTGLTVHLSQICILTIVAVISSSTLVAVTTMTTTMTTTTANAPEINVIVTALADFAVHAKGGKAPFHGLIFKPKLQAGFFLLITGFTLSHHNKETMIYFRSQL